MTRRRFHVPGNSIREGTAILTREQSHYLRHVLRLRTGDRVEIFDGEGGGYSGTVRIHGTETRVEAISRLSKADEPQRPLILAQALIKADRFEWVLQKGTELGVDKFIPLETRFCDARVSKVRIEGRMERWGRIVREASRQSCRFTIPEICTPMNLQSLLSLEELSRYKGLFLYENAADRWDGTVTDAPGHVLCIGPEGGWHPDESDAAAAAGFTLFSLGPRILRAETAALAAVALIRLRIADCGLRIADPAR